MSFLLLYKRRELHAFLASLGVDGRQAARPSSKICFCQICWFVLLLKVGVYIIAWHNSSSVDVKFFEDSKPQVDFQKIHPKLFNLASNDVLWYLEIVSKGYTLGKDSGAFYPVWPFLLRCFGCAESPWSPLIAALASVGFWILGLFLFFRWATRTASREAAWSMVLANLLLPSSMTFWIGFTESFFFFLFVTFLVFTDSRNSWVSWVASFILPMTRPVGIFIVLIPCLWWMLGLRRRFSTGCVLSFLAGWLCYFCIMWYSLGHPLAGWAAQKYHVNAPSLSYVKDIPKFISSLFNITSFHDPTGSLLDRVAFIASFWFVVRLWSIRPSWCITTAAMLLIPAMTNQFLSFSRFTIVAIPLLFPIGMVLQRLRPGWMGACIALAMAVQYYLIHQYFSFGWGT